MTGNNFQIEKYHFISGSILEGLPEKEARFLKENMVRKEEKKDRTLFKEGSYPRGVYFIKKGKVKIFQTNSEGKEQIVYIYTSGESFGYRPLLSDQMHPVSAMTLEDCVFSFIPKDVFIELLKTSTTLANKLLQNLSFEFSVWINTITAFTQKPVKERLALSLLILNEKYRKKNNPEKAPEINLSRAEKAHYIGTSVETLVRMLQHFKKDKIISTKGRKIVILKPEELVKIADFY
jgi:CRP-like cAMP-binding protein